MNNNCNGCIHNKVCGKVNTIFECSDRMSRYASGKELAEIVSRAVNTFRFDSKGFSDVMVREHRTLQQSFMREVILPYLKAVSQLSCFDDQNERSVALAKAIMQRTTDDERCLPFI